MKKNSLLQKAKKLRDNGVNILDIEKLEIRGNLECGKDVFIETNVIVEGNVYLGDYVTIRSNTIIIDSSINNHTEIKSNSLIRNSIISENCVIGPYSRLRSGTKIANNSQIGTFVEIKKSTIGSGCKINHMAFIGDAILGDDVIIGAGTITCNHDGNDTQQTIIHSGSYIGSNVNLIAPIVIEENAIIGAGSTITENAPKNKLTLSRAKQVTIGNRDKTKSK
jgi:bifunctional UDP-N-acetylglucosamine pyrophosphorylase/glucosamine-1-phosphate N-acetyltransferase